MEKEKILWRSQPHEKLWYYWIPTKGLGGSLGYSFFFFITYYGYTIFTGQITKSTVAWRSLAMTSIYFFVIIFILHIPYLYFLRKTYIYTITNKNVIFEGGIITRFKHNLPFHKITNIIVSQGILQRAFGIWDLGIQTAGVGSPVAEITFPGLMEPEKPKKLILGLVEKYQKSSSRYGE